MQRLPIEVIEKILGWLCLEELVRVERVCRRWAQILAKRYYTPYLQSQDWSISQILRREGWSPESSEWELTCKLFRNIWYGLPSVWTGQEDQKPKVKSCIVGKFNPGEEQDRLSVTDIVSYRDKVYLAVEGSHVHIYCLITLERLGDLNTGTHDGEVGEDRHVGPHHLNIQSRACQLAIHSRTLAVTSLDKHRVLLYNCDTDDLVGQIETKLGPIYSLAITAKTLVCLSGWSVLYWYIDSSRPAFVRGQFLGHFPDFEPSENFQEWLEVHSVSVNSSYLVTRATRLPVLPGPSTSFLHVRRVCKDTGSVFPTVLRPNTTSLGEHVVEMSGMALSECGLLASLLMERESTTGSLKYVVRVQDCATGQEVAVLPYCHILGSVQVPVCWREGHLYLKVVPKSVSTAVSEFSVSLIRWNPKTNSISSLPYPSLCYPNSQLSIEAARLSMVTTDMCLQSEPILEDQFPNLTFVVKLEVYDYYSGIANMNEYDDGDSEDMEGN